MVTRVNKRLTFKSIPLFVSFPSTDLLSMSSLAKLLNFYKRSQVSVGRRAITNPLQAGPIAAVRLSCSSTVGGRRSTAFHTA